MNTKFYPSMRKSFLNNHTTPFDLLSHFDDIFYTPTTTKKTKPNMMPKANIYKYKSGYQIELAAPGFSRDEFEMSVDNNVLRVSVNTEDGKNEVDELYSSEWNYSSFTRSWTLPENANIDGISARYEAGILYLEVPPF